MGKLDWRSRPEPGPLAWPCVSLSPAQHAVHTQQAQGLRAPNRGPEVPRLPPSAVPTPSPWHAEPGLPAPPRPQSLPSQQPLLLTSGVGGRVEESGARPPRALQDGLKELQPCVCSVSTQGGAGGGGSPARHRQGSRERVAGAGLRGPGEGGTEHRKAGLRGPWLLRLGVPLGPGLPSQECPLEPGD